MTSSSPPRRCGIYIRVSTSHQAKEGSSLSEQRRSLVDHAERMRWTHKLYEDPGRSGETLDGRPGMLALLALAARPLASLFSRDPTVVETTILYLRLVPIGYGLQGVLLLSNVTLNVLHKPLHAAALVLIQMIVLYIPLAFLGSHFFGLPGIFGAAAFANVTAGCLAFFWVRRVMKLVSSPERAEPYM